MEKVASEKMALGLAGPHTHKAVEAFQDAGKRRKRLKEDLAHFCNSTSFTALVLIYNASSLSRRIGWTIVALAMVGWMSYQTFLLLQKFFSYPMETKTDFRTVSSIEFPSVTICNLNPIKQDVLRAQPGRMHTLSFFTEQIANDDMLFSAAFKDTSSPSASGSGQTQWASTTLSPAAPAATTPTTPTTPRTTPTTTAAASGTQGLQPTSTAIPTIAGGGVTTETPPPATPPNYAPGGRKKRHTADRKSMKLPYDSFDQPRQLQEKMLEPKYSEPEETDDNAEGVHRRRRRETSDSDQERLDVMKNNSYNKWNTLDSSSMADFYQTRGVEYKVAMEYATLSAKLSPDIVKKAEHSLDDLLLTCRFNGWMCSPRNFTYFHSHKYGACYTFNAWDSPTDLYTKSAGPEYGLTMELYIQQDQYVPALAAEAGMRVLVHRKGSYPFPEDDGVSVSPAHFSSLSIRKVSISRLGPPHGSCDTKGQGSVVDQYVVQKNVTYTKLSCLKSCYQDIVNRHCNCSSPIYFVADRNNVCNLTDRDVDDCVSQLPFAYGGEYDDCDGLCPLSCDEVTYDVQVSSAAWPSKNYEDYLFNKVKQCNYLLMDGSQGSENFAKVNVFFKDLTYLVIEEEASYGTELLLSDIGGQLGLWLGLSLFTIGELCGLVIAVCRSLTSGNDVDAAEDSGGKFPHLASSNAVKPFSKVPNDLVLSDLKSRRYV